MEEVPVEIIEDRLAKKIKKKIAKMEAELKKSFGIDLDDPKFQIADYDVPEPRPQKRARREPDIFRQMHQPMMGPMMGMGPPMGMMPPPGMMMPPPPGMGPHMGRPPMMPPPPGYMMPMAGRGPPPPGMIPPPHMGVNPRMPAPGQPQ